MRIRSSTLRRGLTLGPAHAILLLVLTSACGIYTLGGPGHGTRFSVPPSAAMSADPVVQSWAAYSLTKSVCQIEHGGTRPSQFNSFQCELRPREVLVRSWNERDSTATAARDEYLDLLSRIESAGFLSEYVWVYLGKRHWIRPDWLRLDEFEAYRREAVPTHRAKTRIIGWWS